MTNFSLIITAGGTSSRYGKTNKLLEKIKGKEVILHSIEAFLPLKPYEIIISASESLEPVILELTKNIPNLKVVRGGATRQASVFNALKSLTKPTSGEKSVVAIHDAARPLIKQEHIAACIEKASQKGAAIIAVKAIDTIKKVGKDNKILETPDRNELWCVQTPQIFDYDLILDVHKKLEGQCFSDDSGMVESLSHEVFVVEGDYTNLKITTKQDLFFAEMIVDYI